MNTVELLGGLSHGILIVVGSGKMGKSCAGHTIASLFWSHRPKYFLDPEDIDISIFPGYVHVKDTIAIPPGSVIFIEDVNRLFASRSSSNKSAIQKWLTAVSQKDYVVVLTTQSFADTDMAFARSQNTIFVHKCMWHDDIAFERPELQLQQVAANIAIDEYSMKHPEIDRRSICYCPRYGDLLILPIVEWWTDGVHSHIFRSVPLSLMSQ